MQKISDYIAPQKHLLTQILLLVSAVVFSFSAYGGVIEDVFTKDRNLLAVSHYNNLATTDARAQAILAGINPQTPTTNPVISLFASHILTENNSNINAGNWAETILFSLPIDKDNDWVYIFHIDSPEKYIGSLLGTGNIRQEQTEDDITRYRRTDGLDSEVYYLAYGEDNLAIMSRCFAAVKKAVKLYNDPSLSKDGIIQNSDADYNLTFHLNRYFQANSKVLPNFINMLHYDILRDLAGTTAKSDNILNSILNYLDKSASSFINEIAIIDMKAYIDDADIRVNTELFIQYGGSLHYALSAYEAQNSGLSFLLPEQSVSFNNVRIWPEEYIQLLEGIGNMAVSLIPQTVDQTTADRAGRILALFQETNPLSLQQGIISPEENLNLYGPLSVSVITFENNSKISELFTEIQKLLTTGDYSEFLAEKGIKFEINTTPVDTGNNGVTSNETIFSLSSSYFRLPGTFTARQYILSSIVGNHLITVVPLAPLNDFQYNNTRKFCLDILGKTATTVSTEAGKDSVLFSLAQKNNTQNTIINLTVNPLRYIQAIMQSEAIWPSPTPPNRLPVPWKDFSQYYNSKDSSTPPLNLTVNSNRTSLTAKLTIPQSTLISLMQSLLNLTPTGEF